MAKSSKKLPREKVFCIIPARYGSTRVPGKPLRKILDKPLIQWVWENASKVSSFADIFIATDSEEIIASAKKFGGKIIRTSTIQKSGTDRVAEAARKLNISDKDIVINIQSDEPLVHPTSVENLILSLYSPPHQYIGDGGKSKSIDMATLVYPSAKIEEFQNSNIVKVVIDINGFAIYFSRSSIPNCEKEKQDGSIFLKHLGIYGYKMDFLQKVSLLPVSSLEKKEKLEQLRVLENGYKIKVVKSAFDSESVNIEEDFKIVEKLLKNRT